MGADITVRQCHCLPQPLVSPVATRVLSPARRVLLRSLDVGVNVDGVINMLHDYTQVGCCGRATLQGWRKQRARLAACACLHYLLSPPHPVTPQPRPTLALRPRHRRLQRTLEELFIKGPIANTRDNPEFHQVSWRGWQGCGAVGRVRRAERRRSVTNGRAAPLPPAGLAEQRPPVQRTLPSLSTPPPAPPLCRRRWRSSRRCCTPGTRGCCASWTCSSPSSAALPPRCWAPATAAASPWVRRCRGGWLSLWSRRAAAAVHCRGIAVVEHQGCEPTGLLHRSQPVSNLHSIHPTLTLSSHAAGVENAYYEGPLRVRLPVNMKLDADGAFSFEAPLPSPEGALGQVLRRWLYAMRIVCTCVSPVLRTASCLQLWKAGWELVWCAGCWLLAVTTTSCQLSCPCPRPRPAVCGRLQEPGHPLAPAPARPSHQLDRPQRRPGSGCSHAGRRTLCARVLARRCICLRPPESAQHLGSCIDFTSSSFALIPMQSRRSKWQVPWGRSETCWCSCRSASRSMGWRPRCGALPFLLLSHRCSSALDGDNVATRLPFKKNWLQSCMHSIAVAALQHSVSSICLGTIPFCQDMDPEKVLTCPRTKVGDRLGRFIVNRLKVRGMAAHVGMGLCQAYEAVCVFILC